MISKKSINYTISILGIIGAVLAIVTSIPTMVDLFDKYNNITIHGYIKDEYGKPVANARVDVDEHSTHTAIDGRYILSGMSPGIKRVVVQNKNITLTSVIKLSSYPINNNYNYNITLMSYPLELYAEIMMPEDNANVGALTEISGAISRPLREGEHIWIAVNPLASPGNWWPQGGEPIMPYGEDGHIEWNGVAYLGGGENDIGNRFSIEVILVDENLNDAIKYWNEKSKSEGSWPPFAYKDYQGNIKILDKITVIRGS